jgi:hypothetical protein
VGALSRFWNRLQAAGQQPEGGMTYANWRFGLDAISEVSCSFQVDNDPGPNSDLYLQLYDASIDGTGTYHGVQTIDLAIFSRFGTVDVDEIRPAEGSYAVFGTDEGPFVSLRRRYRLGTGRFTSTLRRGDPERDGDWFEFSLTRYAGGGPEVTPIGAIRFPRRTPGRPATLADGGGSWTEFWDNNGPVLHPVPLWTVRLNPPVANGTTPAGGVTLKYSRMPNSAIEWDGATGQVVTTIGGDTRRPTDQQMVVRLR